MNEFDAAHLEYYWLGNQSPKKTKVWQVSNDNECLQYMTPKADTNGGLIDFELLFKQVGGIAVLLYALGLLWPEIRFSAPGVDGPNPVL